LTWTWQKSCGVYNSKWFWWLVFGLLPALYAHVIKKIWEVWNG